MWIRRSFESIETKISLKSWAKLKWVVCSCRRHFDGSFRSHNINLSSAACLWILLVEDTEPIDISSIKRERSKCLSGKKESFNFEWPLIVYVESTILMKQKPESTFNLQVIKKRTSHPSIDLRCDVLFSLSAHFYWVVGLFALTVHLLALLSLHFYWHQKIIFLFIHRMNWTQKKIILYIALNCEEKNTMNGAVLLEIGF